MTTDKSRADALTNRIKAMFVPNPPEELGPSDEPESQYRFGYNTALEDVLAAVEQHEAAPAAHVVDTEWPVKQIGIPHPSDKPTILTAAQSDRAPIYETYTGQNGWLEVSQEEYERTKDMYEHRIRYAQPEPPVADERAAFVVNSDDLDFEPDGQPHLADMANVGHALLEQINRMLPGYYWNDSPVEVISDLINERDEARASSPNAAGAKGTIVGYFVNNAAEGETPHYAQVSAEHRDDPDVVALGVMSPAQAAKPVAYRWKGIDDDWRYSVHRIEKKAEALYAAPPPPAPASAPVGLTDEQRKAIKWAIGMASQHNIHGSPLRALLEGDKQ
ncbi:hypothetical protein [Burkholderia cenocepacia]|uniref:hypothetical protein n=1 Tax=Burkholderia cenocepacia TaxID=95486 RepID=UPI001F5B1F67|nr:hypothetical protein [Burkholderia cenocepacia]